MSRNHPLAYPAPKATKRHFDPLKLVHGNGESKSLLDKVFSHPFMRGPFKKISGQGTIPILIGAAVVAEGHSYLFVRGIAITLCALWFSLDVGVWISETKWKPQYKAIVFCATTCVLSCLAMGVMYWFLLSTLDDQREDVQMHLSATPRSIPNDDVFQSQFRWVNDSGVGLTALFANCSVNRLIMTDPPGIYPAEREVIMGFPSPYPIQHLQSHGDAETISCLQAARRPGHATCADIFVTLSFYLDTQPQEPNSKAYRFVARGDKLEWEQQPLDESIGGCGGPRNSVHMVPPEVMKELLKNRH